MALFLYIYLGGYSAYIEYLRRENRIQYAEGEDTDEIKNNRQIKRELC